MQAQEASSSPGRFFRLPPVVRQWRAAVASAPMLERSSPAFTWVGLAVAGCGFAILAYGWGQVAGLAAVALQIPYLISAGCIGLALIVVGAALIAMQAKRREAAAREEVLRELGLVMREIERLARPRSEATNDE